MEILIKNKKYRVVKDYGETVKTIDLDELVTEYYDNFDFIVGDWAYNKVRLKGFYNKDNNKVKEHNNIENVETYISDSCAYGCKYFILERLKNNEVEKKD